MKRLLLILLTAALLLPAPAHAGACPAPAPEVELGGSLPRLTEALAGDRSFSVLLVGLGGARPGSNDGPFAQTLAQTLRQRLQGRDIRVQIIPTPGMLAKDAAERVRRATTEYEPVLVVWRTGMADALSMTDPAKFGTIVRRVAEWLLVQQADLVLVDLAYHVGSAQEPTYRRYVDVLGTSVRGMDVSLFRRYAIMEGWAQQGATPHLAIGEACLAEMLTDALLRQAQR